MEYQPKDVLDVNHPYFSVIVDIPNRNFITAEIPNRFRLRHMADEIEHTVRLRLKGLPRIRYTVGLTSEGGRLCLDVDWIPFVNSIRNGELQMLLVFSMLSRKVFSVQRFRRDGTFIERNPIPPLGCSLNPEGTLYQNRYSIASNVWGPGGIAPLIPEGPIAQTLIAHGAPGVAELYWEGRNGIVNWPVYLGSHRGNVYFAQGWWEFATYNMLLYRRFCVLTYQGNLQFSVLVFDQCSGALEMKYDRSELSHLVPTPMDQPDDADQTSNYFGIHAEPVVQNFSVFPAYLVSIHRHMAEFSARDVRSIFHRRGTIWITVQRSDGSVWPVELVDWFSTRLMRLGYDTLKDMNGFTQDTVLRLYRVDPTRFVFQA